MRRNGSVFPPRTSRTCPPGPSYAQFDKASAERQASEACARPSLVAHGYLVAPPAIASRWEHRQGFQIYFRVVGRSVSLFVIKHGSADRRITVPQGFPTNGFDYENTSSKPRSPHIDRAALRADTEDRGRGNF